MKYFGTIADPKDLVNKEYIDNGLEVKANVDGAYEGMTVGNAEQLVSTVFVNDKVPYIYRTSGGSADIGNREYDTLVGGTVVWNQIAKNGNFANGTSSWSENRSSLSVTDGVLTVTCSNASETFFGVSQAFNIPKNHVLLTSFTYNAGNTTPSSFTIYQTENGQATVINNPTNGTLARVFEIGDADERRLYFRNVGASASFDTTSYFTITNINLIDLTLLFGSTIANYVNALEINNPGDGVAWVTKLFPQLSGGYYPYNAGELLSVSGVSAHNMTGLNQWDEQWEVGRYNSSTGEKTESTTKIRNKNPIPVIPTQIYYYYCGSGDATQVFFYDVNGNFLGEQTAWNSNSTHTIPSGVYYINISPATSYGTAYKDDICISLYWDGAMVNTYEPYTLNNYSLDSSLTLRGILRLDANNALYYDGDTYEADGTVTRYYAERAYQTGDENLTDAITDGTNTVYKLTTPTTETADSFASPQIVNDFGTEEYVATAQSGVLIPVGHNTNYGNNLRAKLEMAPESPAGDGDYIVRQTSGQNSYVPLVFPVDELPMTPSEDGSYTLQVTISGGTATYSWVSA